MAQTVLQQVLILAAMMMLGFLLGKLGKVERKGADLLSMLLLDVFFPCNILAAASGDFGDMPFSQVIKIALAYMSCFILFTLLAKPIANLLRLTEDDSLVFTRSVLSKQRLCWHPALHGGFRHGRNGTGLAFRALRHTLHVPFHYAELPARKRS